MVLSLFLLLLIFPKIVSLIHSQNPHVIPKDFNFITSDHHKLDYEMIYDSPVVSNVSRKSMAK